MQLATCTTCMEEAKDHHSDEASLANKHTSRRRRDEPEKIVGYLATWTAGSLEASCLIAICPLNRLDCPRKVLASSE